MATLTITAANVGVGSTAQVLPFTVGQATTHGQALYIDTADGLAKPADADAAATAKARCIAITSATGTGQTVYGITSGDLVLGAILTKGTEYYVHTTAGVICTKDELASGDFVTRLGIAKTTSILAVSIEATGVDL